MPQKTDAFLMQSGTAKCPEKQHLHIVCTDPDAQDNILPVSVTTWTNNLCDDSCILNAGDHEFITHKSWVLYRSAKIFPSSEIVNGIKQGNIVVKNEFKPAVFQRIYRGFLNSSQAKPRIKKYLQQNSP